MTKIQFARLQDLPLRDAWKHEAYEFTPWLAENIDHLSDAIGIPLELTGTEVAVESFSADILARNPMDGSVVLIENQLEQTDHTHLGQIMTYLAGLNAQTVVWIAPAFREPHLSAIKWLNEHTADGFSFFAVKARVVRIGDSPFAPIFEIATKPNDWERQVLEKKRSATSGDANTETRQHFWKHYLARHPKSADAGIKPIKGWNCYSPVGEGRVRVSLWIGEKGSGIYVGGGYNDRFAAAELLGRRAIVRIARRLEVRDVNPDNDRGHVFGERFGQSYLDQSKWDSITDWLESRRLAYLEALETEMDV